MGSGVLDREIWARKGTEPFWSKSLQAMVVKWTDDYVVAVVPMIFNDRVVLGRRDEMDQSYHVGWCYDKAGRVGLIAALMWDPETEDEPEGYKKAIGRRDRRWV